MKIITSFYDLSRKYFEKIFLDFRKSPDISVIKSVCSSFSEPLIFNCFSLLLPFSLCLYTLEFLSYVFG